MQTTSEIKVGALLLVALILFILTSLFVTNSSFGRRGYIIEARFPRIEGLQAGAPVKLAGIDIGRVTKIYLEDYDVIVRMRIYHRSDLAIGKNAKVVITSSSVLGDKYLEIMIKPKDKPLPKNYRLKGETPVTMDQFFMLTYTTMSSLEDITQALKVIIDDENLKNNLKNTFERLNHITVALANIIDKINRIDFAGINNYTVSALRNINDLAKSSKTELNEIFDDVKSITNGAKEITLTGKKFMADLAQNGKTAEDLKQTLAMTRQVLQTVNQLVAVLAEESPNYKEIVTDVKETMKSLKEATAGINNIIQKISAYTTEENMKNLENSVQSASEVMEKANKVLDIYRDLTIEPSFEMQYSQANKISNTFGLTINNQNGFTYVGIENLGRENELNLQFGKTYAGFSGKIGIFKNELGIGLAQALTKHVTLGLNFYQPTDPHLNVYTLFSLGRSDLYMRLMYEKPLQQNPEQTWFSLGYKF